MSDPIWPPADSTNTISDVQMQNLTYTDSAGIEHQFPSASHGFGTVQKTDGTIVDPLAFKKDQEIGFTNPNLHRRIVTQDPPAPEDPNYDPDDPESVDRSYLNKEVAPREYDLGIQGVHSYRTTTLVVHDEESTTTEIP